MIEKLKSSGQAAFDNSAAEPYDRFSGIPTRSYEEFASQMTGIINRIKPNSETILEIGGGTGNSTTALLEGTSHHTQIFSVEPSDFIWVANAKREGDVETAYAPASPPEYAREIADRMQPHKERLQLVKAEGEQLPFKDNSMDVIFMTQVFHWLKPEEALPEMYRVLKPDGIVVFDESGAHFDFGSDKWGQDMNSKYVHFHPFARLFRANLNSALENRDLKPLPSPRHLFTLDSLQGLLQEHGFALEQLSEKHPYVVSFLPFDLPKTIAHEEQVKMRLLSGAPDYLQTPGLAEEITREVMQQTMQEWQTGEYNDGKEYGVTLAAFVARKRE